MNKPLGLIAATLLCALALSADTASAPDQTPVLAPVPAPAPVQTIAIDPAAYPEIGDEEMGQLRWAIQLADQDRDDFANYQGLDQFGMTSYRYLIAFNAYLLAVEQYHKLPAAPELIRPRLDRLIDKMTAKPVWEFWAGESVGIRTLEPNLDKPYPVERDPVVNRNIMYSGHLAQMIGLYEALYRDLKWSEPGAIVFEWDESLRFVYDQPSLIKCLHDQMVDAAPYCVECEPNVCFPECNQHPVLAFLLHDQIHGTNFYAAAERFLEFFLDENMIDPRTHETAMSYMIKQGVTLSTRTPRYHNAVDLVVTPLVALRIVNLDSSSANGWTGAFMHAWQPDLIERHYPYQKERGLIDLGDDQAALAPTVWEPQLKYGFFGILAAEVGDLETRDLLLARANNKYDPVWKDGTLHYPYNLAKSCTNLTGVLLAIARALPPNGFYKMHNQIFDPASFNQPKVADVDFPAVTLRRAVYDRERKALIVTTAPGAEPGGETVITLINLEPSRSYALTIDGAEAQTITGQTQAKVRVDLDGRHDLILQEKS